MKNTSGIYLITSLSGKKYVGSAVDIAARWRCHKSCLERKIHANIILQNAWNKYGSDGLTFSILLICSPDDLLLYEQLAIDTINPYYNISRVAGSALGVKWSHEARLRRSELYRGRKMPDWFPAMISAAQKLFYQSKEARQKVSERMRGNTHMVGKRHSAETRQKLSDAAKKRASPPQEIRDRISSSLKGRSLSEATREKMRVGQIKRWRTIGRRLNSIDYKVE